MGRKRRVARTSGARRRKRQRPTKEELVATRHAIWTDDQACPLCGRQMIAGPTLNEHHLIPKLFGGSEKHVIHKVCHDKIHSVFTEAELAHVYNTFEKLKEHIEISSFIKWVRKQDPEFIAKHRRSREKGRLSGQDLGL